MAKVVIETGDRYTYRVIDWLRTGLTGAALGVLVAALSWLIERFVVEALICRNGDLEACAQPWLLASNIAAVLGAVVGAAILIRLLTIRAVAVALAALVTLWGIGSLTDTLGVVEVLVWLAALYGLAYVLYSYIFRIRSIYVAIAVAVVAMLIFRWVAFL